MNLLKHLQFTLNGIFELYIRHGRKYYGFAMLFTILSSIVCFILALAFVLIYNQAVGSGNGGNLWGISLGNGGILHLQDIFSLMLCLSVGIFGLCIRISDEQLPEKMTFSQAFKGVGSETWLYFAVAAVGGSLFILVINDQLLYSVSSDPFESSLSASFGAWKYWISDLVRYIKFFLPFILSYCVIRLHLRKSGIYTQQTNRTPVFWTVIILTFFIQTLSLSFIGLVQSLFMEPLSRLFNFSMLIPVVLSICLYVFILAYCYIGLAGALVFPFLYKSERSIREDGNLDEL